MDQEKIGIFISELRKEKQLTQAQLGERLGVTNKTISRWETGKYMPDLALIQSLCQIFEISVNEFLCGQRLDAESFRREADSNMIAVLDEQKSRRRKKQLSDFLGGAGTGILVSAIAWPNSMKRTVIAVIGVGMICAGWCCRAWLDRQVLKSG